MAKAQLSRRPQRFESVAPSWRCPHRHSAKATDPGGDFHPIQAVWDWPAGVRWAPRKMEGLSGADAYPFGPDLYFADGPTVSFHGFPYPTRMAAARLSSANVWIWSPIALTRKLAAKVQAIARLFLHRPSRTALSPKVIKTLPELALPGTPCREQLSRPAVENEVLPTPLRSHEPWPIRGFRAPSRRLPRRPWPRARADPGPHRSTLACRSYRQRMSCDG